MEFDGKVVVVTGASQGIGRAIALGFGGEGAKVVVSARGEGALQKVRKEIEGRGGQALVVKCDVTDGEQVQRLADKVHEAFGTVDVLVNNAGMAASHKFLTHPDELWDQVIALNLTSVYRVTKAFAGPMVERGAGQIINVASVASKVGSKYMAAYTASKHGVLGLTRALAIEFADHGITVNAICPSYVATPMTEAAIENVMSRTGRSEEAARAYFEGLNPQKRLIEAEEVASLALWLAGEGARGVTGQAINVDGGMVMF